MRISGQGNDTRWLRRVCKQRPPIHVFARQPALANIAEFVQCSGAPCCLDICAHIRIDLPQLFNRLSQTANPIADPMPEVGPVVFPSDSAAIANVQQAQFRLGLQMGGQFLTHPRQLIRRACRQRQQPGARRGCVVIRGRAFMQQQMRIGSAKTKRADGGMARLSRCATRPGPAFSQRLKGRALETDARMRLLQMQAGRQPFVTQ